MKKIILSLLAAISLQAHAQCVQITSIFVNSCTIGTGTGFCDSEGFNEMFTFQVGATPLNVANIGVIWPNNAFQGWCSNALTALKTDSLNNTIISSCGFLREPVGGVIPAGANVIAITSENFCVAANSFEGLTDTMYILYQCNGVSTGHFANNPPSPRTLTLNISGPCTQTATATYNNAIPNVDGATANYDQFGNVTYTINGCNAPVTTINSFWSFTSAICDNFGLVDLNTLLSPNATQGGTWSGAGVSGSNFNPSGLFGSTSITYSVSGSGNCPETFDSTIVFTVDTTPIVTQFLQSCDSVFVNGAWYSSDNFVSFTTPGIPPYGCNTINEITIDITGSIIDSTYLFSCDSVFFNGVWYTSSVELRDTVTGVPATPINTCTEIFFSEYGEGTSNNKYLEIFNGTSSPINLTGYSIQTFFNGNSAAGATFNLSGIIQPNETFVIAHASADATLTALANQLVSGGIMNFNGNDAVGLYNNGVLIDLIGNIGCNPGAAWTNPPLTTVDNSIFRNPNYTTGITVAPSNPPCDFPTLNSTNWSPLPVNTWSNVGTHTANCGGAATGGCDTIFITTIEIAQPAVFNAVNLCTNNPAEVTSFNDTIFALIGCDSIITTTIVSLITPVSQITSFECTNNPALVGIFNTDTILSALGCDSVFNQVQRTLINPTTQITAFECTNNPALAGTFNTDTILSALGCDSVFNQVQRTLITPTTQITAFECTNNPALVGTFNTDTILSALGCDSVFNQVQRTLINPTTQITAFECTNNPALAGTFNTDTILSALGCDSVFNQVQRTLINPTTQITAFECTNNPALAGTFNTDTILSALGCDSVFNQVQKTLINPTTQITAFECTNNPTLAGTFNTDTILSALGCDSVFNQLQIVLVTPVNSVTQQCTNVLSEAGLFNTDTLLSNLGCDSIINQINIVFVQPTTINTTSCTNIASEAGNFSNTILSALGCDSIINNLTVTLITPQTQITDTQCTNNINDAGTQINNTILSSQGCDSIYLATNVVFVDLEVNQTTLSGCDSVRWDGVTYFENFESTQTITSSLGCDSIISTLTINVATTPVANAGNDVTILLGESTTLIGEEGNDYLWTWPGNSSDEQVIEVTPTESTLYTLTVSNDGCSDIDSVLVTVINKITLPFIPDAFTPNGDGTNDIFEIVNAQDFEDIVMRIYNRWGELIYEGFDQNHGWDGTYNGKLQNTGVFVYYVTCNSIVSGQNFTDKGSVTLIR